MNDLANSFPNTFNQIDIQDITKNSSDRINDPDDLDAKIQANVS